MTYRKPISSEYPVYYLNSNEDYIAQLEIFDAEAEKNSVNMYWVIDPFVKLASAFTSAFLNL